MSKSDCCSGGNVRIVADEDNKNGRRISVPFVLRVIPGDELFNMCMVGVVCKYARLIVVMLDGWRR